MNYMYRNYGFYAVTENTVSFYKHMSDELAVKYFTQEKMAEYRVVFKKEMEVLAMSLLEICDAFGFDDKSLISVLGKKEHKNDKEMYQEMLDLARKNPLNNRTVPKGFNQYMKPIIQGKM